MKDVIPKTLKAHLVFHDFFNLSTGGVAAYAVYPFRANSCRDPYASVGGGSPSQFTQLSYLYNKYRVEKCTVRISGYNTCASPVDLGVYWRSYNNSAFGAPTDAQQALFEFPALSVVKSVPPYTGTGMAHPRFEIASMRSMKALYGEDTRDEDVSTTFGTEPTVQVYADLVIVAADGAAVSLTANAWVTVEYDLVAYEPKVTITD